MKNLVKFFSLVFFLAFAVSCGDDDSDSPSTNLENAEFEFNMAEPPITVPSALAQSTDANAQQINTWLATANEMTNLLSNFEIQPGATKSNTPVGKQGAVNGRTKEDVVVYTYTQSDDQGNSISVAYQISEEENNYIFEVFWQYNEGGFQRLIYAEESKDPLRNGFMEVYLTDPTSPVSSSEFILRYEWEETAAGFTFRVFDSGDAFELMIVVLPDNSGSLTLSYSGVRSYEATWNADGTSGTFSTFDSEGNEESSGTWSV
ncbi:MAG: hypothetical protein MJA30_07290 [Cytophagales bacterium]|nr:hypothetical protein [Cytophagales bacterium]